MNKEVTCRKILRCASEGQIRNVGRFVDTVKCKWFNKAQVI